MPSKDKTKIVNHNNKQNKVFNKTTSILDEAFFDSAPTSPDPDM